MFKHLSIAPSSILSLHISDKSLEHMFKHLSIAPSNILSLYISHKSLEHMFITSATNSCCNYKIKLVKKTKSATTPNQNLTLKSKSSHPPGLDQVIPIIKQPTQCEWRNWNKIFNGPLNRTILTSNISTDAGLLEDVKPNKGYNISTIFYWHISCTKISHSK